MTAKGLVKPDGSGWRMSVANMVGTVLLLVFVCYYFHDFFVFNISQIYGFLLSPHALFFVFSAVVLVYGRLSERNFNTALFLLAFGYVLLFYGRQVHVASLLGDNLCQIAYWKILFHPNLAESIGASFTKPGQVLVMGLLFELDTLIGGYAFSAGMCLVMAFCVWSLTRIASDIGGRAAACFVFPLSVWVFLGEFLGGSFSIFLIPLLFTGLQLFFFNAGSREKMVGLILLVLSIHFHIQAVAVVAAVGVVLLCQRRWKDLGLLALLGCISISVWVAIILRIQGSFQRLNSGAAAGYVVSYTSFDIPFAADDRYAYLMWAIREGFQADSHFIVVMLMLMVIGVMGCLRDRYRYYLVVFAALALLLINVLLLGGEFNFERYFALFYGFAISVGVAVLARGVFCKNQGRITVSRVLNAALLAAVVLMFDFSQFNRYARSQSEVLHFVPKAAEMLASPKISGAHRLMTEDDLLYPAVAMEPRRFSSLKALQHFNVLPEERRRAVLAETDLVWIATDASHHFFYLEYVPERAWLSDPFRVMVHEIFRTGMPGSLYGYRFEPLERDARKLLLRVTPEK